MEPPPETWTTNLSIVTQPLTSVREADSGIESGSHKEGLCGLLQSSELDQVTVQLLNYPADGSLFAPT